VARDRSIPVKSAVRLAGVGRCRRPHPSPLAQPQAPAPIAHPTVTPTKLVTQSRVKVRDVAAPGKSPLPRQLTHPVHTRGIRSIYIRAPSQRMFAFRSDDVGVLPFLAPAEILISALGDLIATPCATFSFFISTLDIPDFI
jgi:hypothetical protein